MSDEGHPSDSIFVSCYLRHHFDKTILGMLDVQCKVSVCVDASISWCFELGLFVQYSMQ
jgi:hypothetical protein